MTRLMWMLAAALMLLAATSILAAEPAYDREDWPHWAPSPTVKCWSVATDVLTRDSLQIRHVRERGRCRVAGGRWVDPYTKAVLGSRDVDVDHLVPLRNAWASGGAAWPPARRREYANDLGYRWHLLAVSREANRAKGASGPDRWVPENREFWCQYGQAWATIKFVWGLEATASEREAVRRLVATCWERRDPVPDWARR